MFSIFRQMYKHRIRAICAFLMQLWRRVRNFGAHTRWSTNPYRSLIVNLAFVRLKVFSFLGIGAKGRDWQLLPPVIPKSLCTVQHLTEVTGQPLCMFKAVLQSERFLFTQHIMQPLGSRHTHLFKVSYYYNRICTCCAEQCLCSCMGFTWLTLKTLRCLFYSHP